MGIIEDMKKYDNYGMPELKLEIAVLLKENEMTKTQLIQMSKERNQLFENATKMKLPDIVVSQQQRPQGQPQPQGQPRVVPPVGVSPVRPLPNQGVRPPQ